MFFTDRGRALRRKIEPALEELAHELMQFRGTLNKAIGVAGEGWKVLNDAMGDVEGRYTGPRQSAPY
jgi:hypothetical protein